MTYKHTYELLIHDSICFFQQVKLYPSCEKTHLDNPSTRPTRVPKALSRLSPCSACYPLGFAGRARAFLRSRPCTGSSQQNLAFYTTRAKSRTPDGEDGEESHGGAELEGKRKADGHRTRWGGRKEGRLKMNKTAAVADEADRSAVEAADNCASCCYPLGGRRLLVRLC